MVGTRASPRFTLLDVRCFKAAPIESHDFTGWFVNPVPIFPRMIFTKEIFYVRKKISHHTRNNAEEVLTDPCYIFHSIYELILHGDRALMKQIAAPRLNIVYVHVTYTYYTHAFVYVRIKE